ncbi:oxygenase MpaB family protein [Paeniglutamicibacter cryotolerans]|uniref:Uncharacterized protein (DUF2236 family) n=1 Tax=Paeniglutamicibacter cryotolerans TaxID=670079 RepID=A0A839QRX9_9MICC|nr:oxygenase MpaB family protein [Paeniglutamicibacter cryotolerans]MBB2994811.1 uncharacterized protein (DUF2236 family) [Paeniglutamicibacter cryotolerans]
MRADEAGWTVFGRGRRVEGISDIAPEAVLLVGAGRSVLLQLAHPAVGHGVARHSGFATDPMRRLQGTLTYIYALTNGTEAQRELVSRRVNAAHGPVRSEPADDGSHPAYSAFDPQLQLWVAATLYESGMGMYERIFSGLEPETAERVYRQYGVLGSALQMPEGLWPATRADFRAYWEDAVAGLRVDETARGVAEVLLRAEKAPWWLRAGMPLARFVTIGLLPETVRSGFGYTWTTGQERRLGMFFGALRCLVRVTPRWIRRAPMGIYLRRADGREA